MKPKLTILDARNESDDSASRTGEFPTVKRTRIAEQAYAYLLHKITTGEYKEGEMLPSENELCALFGISRPVVREALQRLRLDGLIESRRGLGSFVQKRQLREESNPSARKLGELLENLEFRSVIEPVAASLAAQRRTEADLARMQAAVDQFEQVAIIDGDVGYHLDFRFHLAVAIAAGNRRFVDAVRMVEYDIDHGVNLVRYLARFDHLERTRQVHAEHTRILDAIVRRDAEGARMGMQDHLEQARIRMIKVQPDANETTARPEKLPPKRASRGRRPTTN